MAPGTAVSRARSSRVVPETYAGWERIASAIRAAAVSSAPDPSTPRARRPNARARPVSDVESSGAPQPSTAMTVDRLAGHLGERRRDGLLHRVVGVEIGVGRPAVDDAGGEHRGVLAGAVHQHRRLRAAVADQLLPGGVVERIVRRGLEVGLGQAHRREEPAYALEVERLARVRGAGQREQVGRQVEADPEHAERLERLVARARQDRVGHVADRPRHRAVGGRARPRNRSDGPRRTRCARSPRPGRQDSSWQASGQGSDAGRMVPCRRPNTARPRGSSTTSSC